MLACSLAPAGVVAKVADLSADSSDADASKCPFLAQLRSPPMVNIPWIKRVQFQVRSALGISQHSIAGVDQQQQTAAVQQQAGHAVPAQSVLEVCTCSCSMW
jgi:hypothetical protein